MDCVKLQQQAAALEHLLPLQHDWFNRLLFQLSFSNIDVIQTLGAIGSGKSTLALALAELLSEQFNVALLTATADQRSTANIQQQWFGEVFADNDLAAQVAAYSQSQALCLIIDDGQNLNPDLLLQLTALPIRCFIFADKAILSAVLTLTINQATLVDAEQLLATQQLNTDQLTLALQQAKGNLNALVNIDAATTLPPAKVKSILRSKLFTAKLVVIVVMLMVFLAVTATYMLRNKVEPANQVSERIPLVSSYPTPAEPSLGKETESVSALVPEIIIKDEAKSEPVSVAEEAIVADKVTDIEQGVENTVVTDPEPVLPAKPSTQTIEQSLTVIDETARVESTAPASLLDKCDPKLLVAANAAEVVLQLAVLSKVSAYERLQARYPELIMQCYQRSWQGQTQFVIVLGPFSDNKQATNSKSRLPGKLATSGSFIKSIKAVQAEIAAFNVSQHLSLVD